VPKVSAGVLMFRRRPGGVEVLLVHPGGPFFRHRDVGAWSIPKGEVMPGEDLLDAACREFTEETGFVPQGTFLPLTAIRQRGGKVVHAWAVEGDLDPDAVRSNTMRLEFPPRSGKFIVVPEVDRAGFFRIDEALLRINAAQSALVRELVATLDATARPGPGQGAA
jgi:predicted NUDIX family NTP pyrophosphohydrolase